ncbi:pantothenate kinase domain containing protein,putative [Babesia bigemina]|uniref:Pantothenate kinase domain containing protein,putative n=1 Tax=Babesia bigemina TaxID=5866 RepID=A0A061D2G5_BABBI|nr:pantothenate kinase domain containing protein,putative [Babesia bigemina]CDR94961.1 pantothenate kinase domain containing protein,putative [Babesia bigemina]|eukprot:XP_012767147.1 pantothenate kinase domain containing protein,putative [Babesia bigemina]
MPDKILSVLKTTLHDLLLLLDIASAEAQNHQLIEESAHKVAHDYYNFANGVISILQHRVNDASDVSHGLHLPDNAAIGVPSLFTGKAAPILRDIYSTSCKIKCAVVKRWTQCEDDSSHHLDGREFSLQGQLPLLPFASGHATSKALKKLSLDIGGTLIKMAYCCQCNDCDAFSLVYCAQHALHDLLHCLERHYNIDRVSHCEVDRNLRRMLPTMIRLDSDSNTQINATGGGAYKYAKLFRERLPQCQFRQIPEMPCVVGGTESMHDVHSCFIRYHLREGYTQLTSAVCYPYLIVNIGSGISILNVTSKGCFERVTGTSIGGATAHGLTNTLLGLETYEDFPILYDKGTNCMDSFSPAPPEATASSDRLKASVEDVARSTSDMVSYNIGQVAFLVARSYGVNRIVFTGSYTTNYRMTIDVAARAVASMAESYEVAPMDVLVSVCGSYAGALGCLLSP